MMKVLIVSATDIEGGAGRAAYRLHQSLLESSINSIMLVQRKKTKDQSIYGPNNLLQKLIGILRPHLDNVPLKLYRKRSGSMFSILWLPFSSVAKKINLLNPDIVHIHWIGSGMLNLKDIAKIKAPIVWSMHDMWLFTGGCHYDDGCEGYKTACGNCKVLGSTKENDLSKKIFKRKEQIFPTIDNLTLVGLSKWLEKSSKESQLFKPNKIINLPNPININFFKPRDSIQARKQWGLPLDKKLILFGAMGATSDPRKGYRELSIALKKLDKIDCEFVIFGGEKLEKNQPFSFKTHFVGKIHSDINLVNLYSAVDVTIVPSLQENLSNSIMESLACATPVVGFDVGGNSDMIEHKKNGYLAKPYESDSLRLGIEWVLKSKNYNQLCQNSRDKVIREFESKTVSKKYIELYKDILK